MVIPSAATSSDKFFENATTAARVVDDNDKLSSTWRTDSASRFMIRPQAFSRMCGNTARQSLTTL